MSLTSKGFCRWISCEKNNKEKVSKRLTTFSFKLFRHRHFVTHRCTFTAPYWSNSQTLSLFHASPSLWYLPCPDCQAQGHEEGGEGCLRYVYACAMRVCAPVYVCVCVCVCARVLTHVLPCVCANVCSLPLPLTSQQETERHTHLPEFW